MGEYLLVITSDHGEEFGDHGHRFHGQTLYEEMTNVPLILHVPGQAPKSISNPIGQMEVAPTILDLLGVPIPKSYEGRSRRKELTSETALPEEPVSRGLSRFKLQESSGRNGSWRP